jgi:hypothetical protein
VETSTGLIRALALRDNLSLEDESLDELLSVVEGALTVGAEVSGHRSLVLGRLRTRRIDFRVVKDAAP